MKKIFSFFVLLFLSVAAMSQSIVQLKGDTIKMFKTGGNAELVLQNSTRDTLGGFLKNMGGGRTEFHTIGSILSAAIATGSGLSSATLSGVVTVKLGQDLAASGDPAAFTEDREIPMTNHEFFLGSKAGGKNFEFFPDYGAMIINSSGSITHFQLLVGASNPDQIDINFGSKVHWNYAETNGILHTNGLWYLDYLALNTSTTNGHGRTVDNFNVTTYISNPQTAVNDTFEFTATNNYPRVMIMKRAGTALKTTSTVLHNTAGNIIDEHGLSSPYYTFADSGKSVIYQWYLSDAYIISTTGSSSSSGSAVGNPILNSGVTAQTANPGWLAANLTAATSGNAQWGPYFESDGSNYNGSSKSLKTRWYTLPNNGANGFGGVQFEYNSNSAGWVGMGQIMNYTGNGGYAVFTNGFFYNMSYGLNENSATTNISAHLTNFTSGTFTATLPDVTNTALGATSNNNFVLTNSGTGVVTIGTVSSQVIKSRAGTSATTWVLNPGDWVEINANSGYSNWYVVASGETKKYGTSTQSGNGSTTTFTIAHTLTNVSATSNITVTPRTAAAAGAYYVTTDATNISIIYTTAPASGTNNLTWTYQLKP